MSALFGIKGRKKGDYILITSSTRELSPPLLEVEPMCDNRGENHVGFIRVGILLSTDQPPRLTAPIDIEKTRMSSILGCQTTDYISLSQFDKIGYRLALFNDEESISKNLPVNGVATKLYRGRVATDALLYGPVLLVDDKKNLTLEDLQILLKSNVRKPVHNSFPFFTRGF